jgi:hypothetical protein
VGRVLFSEATARNQLLNSYKTPTHINSTYGTTSNIDLTICTATLAPSITWETHPDPCDSDHFPILIKTGQETENEIRTPQRWRIDKADWELFNHKTSEITSLPSDLLTSQTLDSFTQFIIDAAKISIPQSQGILKRRGVPWWSDDIKTAIKNRKKALHKYQTSQDPADFIEFKKLRAKARTLIRISKKRSWSLFVSSINEPVSDSAMWSQIKKLTGSKQYSSTVQLQHNGRFIKEPLEVAQVLSTHFAQVASDENYEPSFRMKKNHEEQSPINFQIENTKTSYNEPISTSEVILTLRKLKKNSSPGLDEIHPAMLLNLHPQAIQKLTDLFNRILASGEYPSSWKRAIVVAIPKPNKDPLQPTSYRPISLTSVLAKLFERILNKRLNWYLESNGILSPNQYGFRKKRNTIQAISDLELQIREAFAAKEHLYAIFFDLEKAYDRVWRHHICQLLFKYGLRGNLPSVLQSFLADRSLVVRVADQLSSPRIIQNGVPQGSVFSA